MATSTKERILDVAERLFADFGYKTTSLRDITSEAGVNLASVNYHFGSKEALLTALLERRFAVVNQRRIERLDRIEANAGQDGVELEEIVRSLLAPPFELQSEWGVSGQKFLRLVGRIHSETDKIREVFISLFGPVMSRFQTAFEKALPQVDTDEVGRRTHFLVGAMAHTMMWCDSFTIHGQHPCDHDEILESLVQFGAAGMATPSRDPILVPAGMRKGPR